jgi:uncharacterized membrane protein
MLRSLSTSPIARGTLAAVVVGIVALAWRSVTGLALVILFAVYAFIAARLQAARAIVRGWLGMPEDRQREPDSSGTARRGRRGAGQAR